MEISQDIKQLLKQIQQNPESFLLNMEFCNDEQILVLFTFMYYTNDELFTNSVLYLGQEDKKMYQKVSALKRFLNIFRNQNMDIYYYILKILFP